MTPFAQPPARDELLSPAQRTLASNLAALLQSPRPPRVLNLHGPPNSGKGRISRAVVAELRRSGVRPRILDLKTTARGVGPLAERLNADGGRAGPAIVVIGLWTGQGFDAEAAPAVQRLFLRFLGQPGNAVLLITEPPLPALQSGSGLALLPSGLVEAAHLQAADAPPAEPPSPRREEPSPRRAPSPTRPVEPEGGSPVRRLYRRLCALDSERALETNLLTDPTYAALRGRGEARFCEWAHDRLNQRDLLRRLGGAVLRPSDVERLARLTGVPGERGMDVDATSRLVLQALGVREPQPPPPVRDGLDHLRALVSADDLERPEGLALEQAERPAVRARRGLERMLKLLASFVADAGHAALLAEVMCGGLHRFKRTEVTAKGVAAWIMRAEAGTLNHLLRAGSARLEEVGAALPYLTAPAVTLWSDEAFRAVDALNEELKPWVHDKPERPKAKGTPRSLVGAAKAVLGLVEGGRIALPRAVRFFRRVQDAHGLHFEAYLCDGTRIAFYEVDEATAPALHTDYLFLAATNPAAVDMRCVTVRPELLAPV